MIEEVSAQKNEANTPVDDEQVVVTKLEKPAEKEAETDVPVPATESQ